MKRFFNKKTYTAIGASAGILLLLWPWLRIPGVVVTSALKNEVWSIFSAFCILALFRKSGWNQLFASCKALTYQGIFLFVTFIIFTLWQFFSITYATEPLSCNMWLIIIGKMTIVTLAVFICCRRSEVRQGMLQSFIISGGAVGVVVIGIRVYFFLNPQASTQGLSLGVNRIYFPFGMPAALGTFEMLACLAALSLLYDRLFAGKKIFFPALALALSLAGLALSGTLSCFSGTVAGIWMLLFLQQKRKFFFAFISLAVLLIFSIILFNYLQTPAGKTKIYNTSWGIRLMGLETSGRMLVKHPWRGWGAGSYIYGACREESNKAFLHSARGGYYLSPHCEPAQVAAELGVIGLLFWLALFAAVFFSCNSERKREGMICGKHYLGFGGTLQILFFALLTDSLFNPVYRQGTGLTLVAILLGLALAGGINDSSARAGLTNVFAKKTGLLLKILALPLVLFSLVFSYFSLMANLEFSQGYRYLKSGQLGFAEKSLRKARKYTDSFDLWQRATAFLGEAVLLQGRSDEAIAVNQEVVRRMPTLVSFSRTIVRIERKRGRLGREFIATLAYLYQRPYSIEFRLYLYDLSARLKPEYLEFMRNWRKDSRLEEWSGTLGLLNESDWQFLLALNLFQRQKQIAAKKLMSILIPKKLHLVPYFSEYGRMLVLSGENAKAVTVLEPVCRNIPADPVALYYLAIAYKNIGGEDNYGKAFQLLGRALQTRNSYADAAILYSSFCLADKKYKTAISVLELARRSNPGYAPLLAALVQTYKYLGKPEISRRELTAAIKKLPNSPVLRKLANTTLP